MIDTTGTFWLPPSSSTIAGEVDTLFYFLIYLSLFFFVLIVGLLIYFSVKYRRSKEDEIETVGPSHNSVLEMTWMIIPTIIVLVIFVWGVRGFLKMSVVPAEAMEVKVTGQKWFWSFDYPEGASSVNELVVPVNKPVKLLMSSKDVIHSFFVPNFRVKRDVIPNRYSVIWFEATQEGLFDLFCAEYCGSKHSQMIGKVRVISQSEYETWLETEVSGGEGVSPAEYGAKLYKKKACITCHTIDGSANNGPSFLGVFGKQEKFADGSTGVVDENYIRESILVPNAKVVAGYQSIMPTYQGLLKDREIDALVAYIKSLRGDK